MSDDPVLLTPPNTPGRRLLAFLAAHGTAWRRLGRGIAWLAGGGLTLFILLLSVLYFLVFPRIQEYRGDVERLLGESLGLKLEIAAIASGWQGIEPDLILTGVRLHDRQGRPALGLDRVEAVLSWSSLWHGTVVLDRLEVAAPSLSVRREADGRIFIAGIALDAQSQDSRFSDWLLAQHRVVIRDARITWDDAKRQAPSLELAKVNLVLENAGARHRFGLKAEPPAQWAAPLDIRGDLHGSNLDQLQDWKGEIYAATTFADLAIWRQWLDYPLALPQGTGSLRLWLNIAGGKLASARTDLSLSQVRLRLAPDLPELDLAKLSGHLSLAMADGGFDTKGQNLTLETSQGIRISPMDFSVRAMPARKGLLRTQPAGGEVTASALDLEALGGLAAYLPLPAEIRKHLSDFSPKGRLAELKVNWEGEQAASASYAVKSRFEQLGLAASGNIPGFQGLSGSVEGSDKDGTLTLESRDAALLLPAVFPEPRLAFDHLKGKLLWKKGEKETELDLKNLAFANRDAEGFSSGRYWLVPGQIGRIDLSAQITRGDGRAVWRYLPFAVNKETRDWLRAGITGGTSRDTRLTLKGDLKDFPYVDGKSGTFRITVKMADASLHYGDGWPDIQGIGGDLLFEGKRMHIRGERARMFGVGLSGVEVELPDLLAPEEIMTVVGRAQGPTSDFLRFIAESPVAERIEHFTEGMKAEGAGNLQLSLTLPLRRIKDSSVKGEFQFMNNRVLTDPDLPPLTDVNGRLQFTGQGVTVKSVSAQLLGGPMSLSAATRNDGSVAIAAQGTLSVANLRRTMDWPLLEHLSGSSNWKGAITVRHRNADLVLESSLAGISSALPEPFNKTAGESLPLKLERLQLAGTFKDGVARDMVRASLGRALALQLRRKQEGGKPVVEAGAVALQSPSQKGVALEMPPLPEKGIVVNANLAALNLDFWRRAMPSSAGGSGASLPLAGLALRAGNLTAFGRTFNDLSLKADVQGNVWQAQVASPDVTGDFSWNSRGRGRVKAHLKQFTLSEAREESMQSVQEPLRQLPGMEIVVDDFRLKGMELGKLEMDAENRGGAWLIRRVALANPDGKLSGNGEWRLPGAEGSPPGKSAASRLAFKMETPNTGKLLERVGYAGVVRNGAAKLEGELAWNGPPTSVDYPSLQGKLNLEVGKGQFNKLNPGVGRLLGILSLQSLPRRITLDFNDVFSQGFAFDSITGDVKVEKGLVSTQNLRLQGPAAQVFMSGDANILQETQNLLVRVQPAVGETLSVGTMLINPAVGVATYVAQKLLKDPLGQAFEFDYRVTGPWSEPLVEKVRAGVVAKAETPAEVKP